MQQEHTLGSTALELASSLIPIRPLIPGLKRPWPGPDGKAMTLSHPDSVLEFYTLHPEANVGACLAPIDHSPIVVVDIDICDVTEAERPKVWAHLTSLGVTTKDRVWIQRTGRDNWQVFYWALDLGENVPLRHIDAGGMHVDLLSNGYVVVAPSDTSKEIPKKPGLKGGGLYRWFAEKSPWGLSLSDVSAPPAALIHWWKSQTQVQTTGPVQNSASFQDDGLPITAKRNVTLASIAGVLALSMGPMEMAAQLREINRRRCIPPLPDREVETIIRSINTRETNRPGKSLKDDGIDELHLF